jgi:hypothetical protein
MECKSAKVEFLFPGGDWVSMFDKELEDKMNLELDFGVTELLGLKVILNGKGKKHLEKIEIFSVGHDIEMKECKKDKVIL